MNSYKAVVAYHLLDMDRSKDIYDEESFMQYIAIPRHASYAAKTNKKDKKESHQAKYVIYLAL